MNTNHFLLKAEAVEADMSIEGERIYQSDYPDSDEKYYITLRRQKFLDLMPDQDIPALRGPAYVACLVGAALAEEYNRRLGIHGDKCDHCLYSEAVFRELAPPCKIDSSVNNNWGRIVALAWDGQLGWDGMPDLPYRSPRLYAAQSVKGGQNHE